MCEEDKGNGRATQSHPRPGTSTDRHVPIDGPQKLAEGGVDDDVLPGVLHHDVPPVGNPRTGAGRAGRWPASVLPSCTTAGAVLSMVVLPVVVEVHHWWGRRRGVL